MIGFLKSIQPQALNKRYLLFNDIGKWKIKKWKKICPANVKKMKVGVTIQMSD